MPHAPLSAVVWSKRAIVFDLFHTLTAVDVTSPKEPTTAEVLGVPRHAWSDQLLIHSRERLIGAVRDPYVINRRMARAIDPTIPDEIIRAATLQRLARFAHTLTHIPAPVPSVLARLRQRGMLLGLLSNADAGEAAAWDRSPIAGLFHSVVFSCNAGYAKPDHEIFGISLRELGVAAEEAIFVGDGGSNELEAAREVGMTAVMAAGIARRIWPERIRGRVAQADYVIESLEGLLAR